MRTTLTALLLLAFASAVSAQPKEIPAEMRPALVPPVGTKELKDIEYARVGDVSLKLDLYLPPKPQASSPKPGLIVYIHGGGWRAGDKGGPPLMWLIGEGYAIASIQYRLSDVAKFPAGVHDCKGAIRWLRANADKYGYDATRIGVAGVSAGGHLSALLGTSGDVKELEGEVGGNTDQSSRVQAVVNFVGPTDFLTLHEQKHPEFTTSLVALWLDSPVQAWGQAKAKLASPLHHVTADDAPVLNLAGDKDPLVMVPQITTFDEACRKAGVESAAEVIVGGGHGGPQFFDETRRAMVSKLFARHAPGEVKNP